LLSHNREIIYSEKEDYTRIQRVKNDETKRYLEAALFNSRRILSLDEISSIFPDISKNNVLKFIHELIEEYKTMETSFEIIELSENRFELKIKDSILNSVGKFTQGDLLKNSDVKILAVIAYLQPSATRREIRLKVGSSSTMYKSLNRLKKLNFIVEDDHFVKLTRYFFDYFQLKTIDNERVKNILVNSVLNE